MEDFKSIFVQVVQIASGAGLVRLGTVAIDGTKVRTNASKHKAMSYGRSNRHDLNSPSKTKTVYQRPIRWTHDHFGDRFMRGFSFSVNPAITANSSNMRVNPVCGISA